MGRNVEKKPLQIKHLYPETIWVPPAYRKDTPNAAISGMTATHKFDLPRVTRFTFDDVEVTITDADTNGAHGSIKLTDFATGLIRMRGAVTNFGIVAAAGIGATGAVLHAIGSATVGVDNATLSSTEADILPSTSTTLVDSAGDAHGESTAEAIFDGTSTALDAYLNFAISAADATANSTLTLNGYVDLFYSFLGDN